MAGAQHAGIEKIPPLQHDEDREEDGQFDIIHSRSLLKVPQQREGNYKEQSTNSQNASYHGTGNDKGIAGSWLLLHHLTRGWQ